jgi:hypothetical protein
MREEDRVFGRSPTFLLNWADSVSVRVESFSGES